MGYIRTITIGMLGTTATAVSIEAAWERITVRGYERILSIAWTLADLRAQAQLTSDDVDKAVELRLGSPICREES